MAGAGRRILAAAVVAVTWAVAGGCVTIERQWSGEPCRAALDQMVPGRTTLAEALARLGAPQAFHRQPEGLLLIYRVRSYRDLQIGLNPAPLLRLMPLESVAAQAAQNLKYVRQTGIEDEDRIVLLFDAERTLAGKGIYLGAEPR